MLVPLSSSWLPLPLPLALFSSPPFFFPPPREVRFGAPVATRRSALGLAAPRPPFLAAALAALSALCRWSSPTETSMSAVEGPPAPKPSAICHSSVLPGARLKRPLV